MPLRTIRTYDNIEVQVDDASEGKVVYVWLNSPKTRNACSYELLDDIATCYTDLSTNFDARVIVMAGRGKSFCAGANLKRPPNKGDGTELTTFREARCVSRKSSAFARFVDSYAYMIPQQARKQVLGQSRCRRSRRWRNHNCPCPRTCIRGRPGCCFHQRLGHHGSVNAGKCPFVCSRLISYLATTN